MGPTEATTAVLAAENPPVEVEVLQIALAAAEAGEAATGEAGPDGGPPDGADQRLQALAAAHAEQRRKDAERYRAAVLRSNPEAPPDLVAGATVEEVDASLAAALATVAAVRRHLARQAGAGRVPAGAPLRGQPDVRELSPRQKIALALVSNRPA